MNEDIMKSHESTRQVTSDYTGLLRISPLWKVITLPSIFEVKANHSLKNSVQTVI